MGVPGPVTSRPSEGVHELIRTGAAALVTRGSEVLELVSPVGEHLTVRRRGGDRRTGSASRQPVLDAVPLRQAAVASIARTAGIGLLDVDASLHRLERAGLVEASTAGGGSGRQCCRFPAAAPRSSYDEA